MYELIQVSEHDHYIDCPSRMGIVKTGGNEVVMIDSGNDASAAKKALRVIKENGWELKAVYNTHSHADHIGGNRYLQENTGCRIFANGKECDFIRHPEMEPHMLCGGYPAEELLNKFFMAKPSQAEQITDDVLPEGWSVIPLPGHSEDQVGFITPDKTAYIGDALASEETLSKYAISYTFDIGSCLSTIEKLKETDASCFVPSHATHRYDIAPLCEVNTRVMLEVAKRIRGMLIEPCTHDELMKKVFDAYEISMSIPQFCLIGTTVRSYVLWMREKGMADCTIRDNRILWQNTADRKAEEL